MATQPINDLLFVAEEDIILESTGYLNKLIPNSAIRTNGWDKNEQVAAEHLNYWGNNHAQYLQYLIDRLDEVDNTITALTDQIEKERVSIGEIIEITGVSTNPNILKGYGTWESFGAGQVLVGVGSFTDTNSETLVWSDGETGGEYSHTMTQAELVDHTHTYSGTTTTNGAHTHPIHISAASPNNDATEANLPPMFSNGNAISFDSSYMIASSAGSHAHTYSGTTTSTGTTTAFNVMQPTLAVYRWKRTA
jgi:microcystin-dependent protein